MSHDDKTIEHVSPSELAKLMAETGKFTVTGIRTVDARPVIEAQLKVRNVQTGEKVDGGLPFTVILFKDGPGHTNIAVAARIPPARLNLELTSGFFNQCNERCRFLRAYADSTGDLVLQMDLVLRMATREYVKFNLGIWSTAYCHVVFGLLSQSDAEQSDFGNAPADGDAAQLDAAAEDVTATGPEATTEPESAHDPDAADSSAHSDQANALQPDEQAVQDDGLPPQPDDAPMPQTLATDHSMPAGPGARAA